MRSFPYLFEGKTLFEVFDEIPNFFEHLLRQSCRLASVLLHGNLAGTKYRTRQFIQTSYFLRRNTGLGNSIGENSTY